MQVETRYARLGRDRIAYQVIGQGPPDLVLTIGNFSHVDMIWEDPGAALFLRTLASFCRLIRFDRQGTGASDPLPPGRPALWDSYTEELVTVLDEVGSERAALMATLEAGPMAILFAGTRPERITALILGNTAAKLVAAKDYPIGIPPDVAEALVAQYDQLWGTEAMAMSHAPSRAGDKRYRRWAAKYQRAGASPGVVQAFLRGLFSLDVRPALPLVQVPTLVLHRRDFQPITVEHGRFVAAHIPGAELIELPGADGSLMWETRELVLETVEDFLTGIDRVADPTRVLATVLFTDIVGSTEQARRLGDRRWRERLNVHDEVASKVIAEMGGRLVETTGDAILATFDSPSRGISCAAVLRDQLGGIGLQIRAGLHIGEVELRDTGISGITVHIAARVMAAARPGEIMASRTMRDLVAGSDIVLEDRGSHALKGVEGTYELFAVARP